ncbi:MAG: hypothetical protein J6A21_01930 [Lentisphaeria bacterium]|nr:hypothetical protein [Lentisphaeria bacterium]
MRRLILDTDWWTDCDDAMAVRILCNAHRKRECEIAGININACMEYSVASLDVFTRDSGVFVPLGVDHSATLFAGSPPYQKHLAACGKVVLRENADVPDSADFYRKLLAGAAFRELEILSIGFTQDLAGLLKREEDLTLVREKVRHLWIMAGKWDEDGGKEYNFCKNALTRESGELLCRFWPTPITFLGWEAGHSVISGGHLPEGDLLRQVMEDHGSPHGRSSWDPMLVLLALAGDPEKAGYKCVYGQAQLNGADGANHFLHRADGPHRFVVKLHPDEFYAEEIDKHLPRLP